VRDAKLLGFFFSIQATVHTIWEPLCSPCSIFLPDATEKEVEDKQGRQGETPPDRSRCSEAGQVVRSAEKRGRTRAGDNVT